MFPAGVRRERQIEATSVVRVASAAYTQVSLVSTPGGPTCVQGHRHVRACFKSQSTTVSPHPWSA